MIINGYPLDENQMKPILENPKYSLIIAGAGSGKTMTLIGKIKYLLTSQKCREEEILCLSFTNETVRDLQEKIFVNMDLCQVFRHIFLKDVIDRI